MSNASTFDRRHGAHFRMATAFTAAACAAVAWFGAPPLRLQILAAGVGIAVLGFPHGALDPLVATVRGSLGRRPGHLRFLVTYLALALLVVGLWVVSAPLGLALFLLTSAVHFGEGDAPLTLPRRRRFACVLVHGSAPIVLPAALHPEGVGEVFGWLLMAPGESISAWLTNLGPWCLGAWALAAGAAHAGRWDRRERRSVVELVVLAAAFFSLPPLVSFTVYFCAWHSVRHLIAVDVVLGQGMRSKGLWVAAGILVATALLLALGHWSTRLGTSAPGVLRTLFIALAALTPPHMLVTARLTPHLRDRELRGTAP